MRKRGDGGQQLGAQRFCRVMPDRHDDRQRHAAFARRTEGGAGEIADHGIEIGIGHDDGVVLGAAHRLDALVVGPAALTRYTAPRPTSRRS